MLFNGALSSILPNILTENQQLLADAIENFALPHVNSAMDTGMSLESLIRPPPKKNPFFETHC
jgi:hypothetical protein